MEFFCFEFECSVIDKTSKLFEILNALIITLITFK